MDKNTNTFLYSLFTPPFTALLHISQYTIHALNSFSHESTAISALLDEYVGQRLGYIGIDGYSFIIGLESFAQIMTRLSLFLSRSCLDWKMDRSLAIRTLARRGEGG